MTKIKKKLLWQLSEASGLPSFLYHFLLSWIYSTHNLRTKAASTPYMRVRKLLLRRSGVLMGNIGFYHYGLILVGASRNPPPLQIGERVAIGPYVTFLTSSIPSYSRLEHHPGIQSAITISGIITLQDDVWIGGGVTIMPNITIGRGAVVGSGSVVTKDIPAFSVVMGVPARVVKVLSEFE